MNSKKIQIQKKYVFKEDYQNVFTKIALVFLFKPVPFNGQDYENKRDLEIVTSCSSSYKTSSEKFLD